MRRLTSCLDRPHHAENRRPRVRTRRRYLRSCTTLPSQHQGQEANEHMQDSSSPLRLSKAGGSLLGTMRALQALVPSRLYREGPLRREYLEDQS